MTPVDTEPGGTAASLAEIESRTAGDRIIRGGTIRAVGYLFSTGATAVAFALLLRHLGVADFGRFSTVIALVTIAAGLAEAGLQVTAQRRFAVSTPAEQRMLLADVIGIRLAFTPLAVIGCALFAIVAGYGSTMVWGTLVAGGGAVIVVVSGSMAIPLAMHLRYVALTAIEVARQFVIVVGIAILVAVGAGLGAFFGVYLASGVAMLVLTVLVVGRAYVAAPRVRWATWRPILVEAAPLAVSLALNVLYLKVLIVMASLLTTDEQVGYFATASRVTEVLVGLPTFMVGVAFPLLAHAGAHDKQRLTYALQRIAEVTLLVACGFVVLLVVGAEPIIAVFGGPGYDEAVPVLRIQALALLGASMTQAWIQGVVAVGAQRSLIAVNVVALGGVLVFGLALIPAAEAQGAAVAAVAGETLMALAMLRALVRARPELRPDFRFAWRVLVAAGLALLPLVLPVAGAVQGVLAACVYAVAALALRAVPVEVIRAFIPAAAAPPP